jgi:hypothetical protein
MRILFENGTPRGLARFLAGRSVDEARALGWKELENGDLIEAAEQAGFELIVTTDKNIRYQQNLQARNIAHAVLEHSRWPMVKLVAEAIAVASMPRRPAVMSRWKCRFRSNLAGGPGTSSILNAHRWPCISHLRVWSQSQQKICGL